MKPPSLLTVLVSLMLPTSPQLQAKDAETPAANLALVAVASGSYGSGDTAFSAMNDGFAPVNSEDRSHGSYGNWPTLDTQTVEYAWEQPVATNRIEVYWWNDHRGIGFPKACRVLFWNGKNFEPVKNSVGLGVEGDRFNVTTFDEVKTTRLRLEIAPTGNKAGAGISTGIIEWRVIDSGNSPAFAPKVIAGIDRSVVVGGKTYLAATVKAISADTAGIKLAWSKVSGPGEVSFQDPHAVTTTASFSAPGEYELKLTASNGASSAADTLHVKAFPAPPAKPWEPAYVKSYQINSPLWNERLKTLVTTWIPQCVARISDPATKEGGINNIVEAGRKLAGQPHAKHIGYPFSNAWVLNIIESMCVAMELDPQGDAEIIKAQASMRKTLDEWMPIVLAAQEPDGYFQTRFTLAAHGEQHWNPATRGEHEGYIAGYFLEMALAHFDMTDRKDPRLYNAAKRLADCWVANIGPAPKKPWFDGHQEMEQALVRFGRFVNEDEGGGKGKPYIELAKFLLDSRAGGEEYDQSHLPVTQQYQVVGHAVRAAYQYSAMSDVAMETRDPDYQSAVLSVWDNVVNRKLYLTGGVGSGETSEGFGPDYSLPNQSYCESCSNCGELFFQYKMNLTWHHARFADLYEDTIYNAILGDYSLDGKFFNYTNALDDAGVNGPYPENNIARYTWHVCPCCVGNFPRTLLMLPMWMYARSDDGLAVNLFAGSSVDIRDVAGTNIRMIQETNHPWDDKVSLTVKPEAEKNFALRIRVPQRNVSKLYTNNPPSAGLTNLQVNGQPVNPTIIDGYAVITRTWKSGDKVAFTLPMEIQRVKADEKVAADHGKVALRYGPLIYNFESVDQNLDSKLSDKATLATAWKPDLLGGVKAITGTYADGSPLLAVPNYSRLNRGGRSVVWMEEK
ncbi:MAG: beta-L-arabinofuranosidase domain-containing protein [Luteolibacter sp.]